MSFFKKSQYEIIAAVINRTTKDILHAQLVDEINARQQTVVWQMSQQVMETLIDELCFEFVKDNHLFNETLFRAKCGNEISNQHAINEDRKSC